MRVVNLMEIKMGKPCPQQRLHLVAKKWKDKSKKNKSSPNLDHRQSYTLHVLNSVLTVQMQEQGSLGRQQAAIDFSNPLGRAYLLGILPSYNFKGLTMNYEL